MRWDNIVTISITILEVNLALSICFWSVCVALESDYGDGWYGEFGVGKRRAMSPKEDA